LPRGKLGAERIGELVS